jgi:hypothetical protein
MHDHSESCGCTGLHTVSSTSGSASPIVLVPDTQDKLLCSKCEKPINGRHFHLPDDTSVCETCHTLIKLPIQMAGRVGRNDKCPCGSNLKYKKCCLGKVSA